MRCTLINAAWPSLQWIYVFLDTQFRGRDTADTEQDFLFQTVLPITAIKLVSDGAVELAVHPMSVSEQIKEIRPRSLSKGKHVRSNPNKEHRLQPDFRFVQYGREATGPKFWAS